MVVTAYFNSKILKQEAAINIEEEAIKAKKAALNLRKAIDRKVVRAINNIREAIEKYPEYLEIIRNEFTNTKVDTQKEADIKQDLRKDTIYSGNILKIIIFGITYSVLSK